MNVQALLFVRRIRYLHPHLAKMFTVENGIRKIELYQQLIYFSLKNLSVYWILFLKWAQKIEKISEYMKYIFKIKYSRKIVG